MVQTIAPTKLEEQPTLTSSSSQPTSLQSKPDDSVKASGRHNLDDQTNYVPVRKIISIFLSCATISTTALLDETMVAVALPTISAELGGGNQISWVATSFFM
jgi:hypothetical protein